MKKIVLITFAIVSQLITAQRTEKISDFNKLKVFDKLNVKLISSTENKISITGTRKDELEIVNNNGELKLRMSFPKLLSGNDIKINLYFKKLESIDASEGSYVFSERVFKQINLDLNAKEGSQIHLEAELQSINCRAVSGSTIEVAGKATNQQAKLGSGGILEAKELITTQTAINISTGGQADIYATDFVDAKVTAGGTINVFGNPKKVTKKTTLGGSIIEQND